MMDMNPATLVGYFTKSRLWCRRLLIFSVGLITIASVIPHGSAATLTVPVVSVDLDKIVHFLGFAFLLLLAFAASKHLSFWQGVRALAYVVMFGAVIEIVQYFIPYRTFNPVDIFANLCGVVFGALLLWVLFIVQRAKREARSAERIAHSGERRGHSGKGRGQSA